MQALDISRTVLHWLGWNSVFAAAALCGVVLLLRVWRRAPASVAHLCWWLVFARLVLPVDFGLPFSVGSLLPDTTPAGESMVLVGFLSGGEASSLAAGEAATGGVSPVGWPVLLTALWAAGTIGVYGWLSWRRRKFTSLIASARAVDDPVALGILDRCAHELGLGTHVRLVHGEGAVSPFTVGVVQPVIWIPTRVLEDFDPALLRCLVAHELVHVARRDDLFIRLQLVVESLFFFHPLVWIAGSRIDRSRERACDEHVVARMNVSSYEYGRSLIETLRFNLITPIPMAGFGSARKRSLEMRLRALSSIPRNSRLALVVPLVAAWLLLPLSGQTRAGTSVPVSEPPSAPLTADAPADDAVRVGGDVKPPRVVKRIDPQYSAEAREKRVTGIVIVEAVIDQNGRVEKVRALKGLPFGLTEAATEAVRQWEFEPATKNGVPVKVLFNVTASFRLDGGPRLSNPLPEARVSSPFGERRSPAKETIELHSGVDLAASKGTPVVAAGEGEVLVATTWDADRPDSGTFVIIDHGSDLKTFYSHLDTLAVVAGQRVRGGDTIGTVGTTGVTSGPHLHFEVWSADHPVDPSRVLKK